MEKLFLFCKEGILKDALTEYRNRKDATSHHMLAAIILNSDTILNCLRKEVRQVSDILVDKGVIEKVLREQVIKREALEGEHAQEAQNRFLKKIAKAKKQQAKAGVPDTNGDVNEVGQCPPEADEVIDAPAEEMVADSSGSEF